MPCVKPWFTRLGQGTVLAMLLVAHSAVWSADDLVTSQQVEEARLWQSKGRTDLAANAWRRILVTKPQHGEALTSLGIIEAQAGHLELAQALYQRAKRARQRSRGLDRLAGLLEQASAEVASPAPRQPPHSDTDRSPKTSPAQPTAPATTKKKPSASAPPATTMASSSPVPPPNPEVRITPLPFVQLAPAKVAHPAESEEVHLKPSESMRHISAPASAPATPVADSKRRPKPCRLPTVGTVPPPAN